MKHITASVLCLPCLFAAAAIGNGQQAKETIPGKELRGQCLAHLYFTSAMAEDEDKQRLPLFSRAIELDPALARAYYNRGAIHARRNELAAARADFQKAAALKDDYMNAHYNLACILSLEGRLDDALASLEKALARGYQKFDKIPADPDLKGLKEQAAFAKLIARYRAGNDPKKLNAVQKMQTFNAEQRAELLEEALRNPDQQALPVALWALQEPDVNLRILAVHLLRKLDNAESKPALVRALHDANGLVCKAAASALVSYGKDAHGLMTWVLEEKGPYVPFYAMQVLARTKATGAADKIAGYLRHADPKNRIVAAESLALLEAVAALPEMEATLKNLPKNEREHDFYKAALGRAIEQLRKVSKSGNK